MDTIIAFVAILALAQAAILVVGFRWLHQRSDKVHQTCDDLRTTLGFLSRKVQLYMAVQDERFLASELLETERLEGVLKDQGIRFLPLEKTIQMRPGVQLSQEIYSNTKELWKASDLHLANAPFPILAVCAHDIRFEDGWEVEIVETL